MAVSALAFLIVAYEWWRNRRRNRTAGAPNAAKPAAMAAIVALPLMLWQCSTGPRPINYGNDACAFCKMTLMDKHYGAEIVTQKGKVFVVDDTNCFINFLKNSDVKPGDVAGRYITDYAHPGVLLEAEKAVYLHSDGLKTPMAAGVAAFANGNDLEQVKAQIGGEIWNWEQVQAAF